MKPKTLALSLLLVAAAHAHAQNALSLAQGFADAEAKATLAGDKGWSVKNLAPEYAETNLKGKRRTKAQVLAQYDENRKTAKATKVAAKVVKASMVGDRLTTTLNVTVLGTMDPGDGKTHRVEYHGVVEDVWAKRGGKWLKTSERTTKESGKIDGKPY